MYTLSSLLPCALLLTLATTAHGFSASTSQSKLVRRDEKHEPATTTYIMRDNVVPSDYEQGFLPIFNADGSVAFKIGRSTFSLSLGLSQTVTTDRANNALMVLDSTNDSCNKKTQYKDSQTYSTEIELKTRGLKRDRWYIHLNTPKGRVDFRFKRDTTDKTGKVYRVDKDKDVLVAEFTTEIRHEAWLKPGKKGVWTYTLHLYPGTPAVYMATLMGLVRDRVSACGL